MAEIGQSCVCAFCASLERLRERNDQGDKHGQSCLRCGREWSNPAECYCLHLEQELVAA